MFIYEAKLVYLGPGGNKSYLWMFPRVADIWNNSYKCRGDLWPGVDITILFLSSSASNPISISILQQEELKWGLVMRVSSVRAPDNTPVITAFVRLLTLPKLPLSPIYPALPASKETTVWFNFSASILCLLSIDKLPRVWSAIMINVHNYLDDFLQK